MSIACISKRMLQIHKYKEKHSIPIVGISRTVELTNELIWKVKFFQISWYPISR